MSVTISIRFLTGRAHLHPWQTHHSEGRVEWPPSPWRLLRALVAVAGRGLTSLPYPDDVPPLKHEAVVNIAGMAKPKERGVPAETKKKLSFSKPKQTLTLKEPLTDAEVDAWKAANPGEEFAAVLDQLQELAAAPDLVAMGDFDADEIPLSRLAELLNALSATPSIWLPKTSGGHTRQYFPIHSGGMVKNTGSAVFDTFATVRKDQPLLFHWPNSNLSEPQFADLRLLLSRMTYFGRAESWCRVDVHPCPLEEIMAEGMSEIVPGKTHWECRCIEDHGKPDGREYRDYLLEHRLVPVADVKKEVPELLPRTNKSDGKKRNAADADKLKSVLGGESVEKLLLRCLLRESGRDIKDGLERPIGTRWVYYAVPRVIFDVPRAAPQVRSRTPESVNLVVYALNTATVHRPVLPPLTDTLLVADQFRRAALAVYGELAGLRKPCDKEFHREDEPYPRVLCGHERNRTPCKDHQHAFWWPIDQDNDGFIDHVVVFVRWQNQGFHANEVAALRRLTRIRQRGGRPDLLVTPIYIGRDGDYQPWQSSANNQFPTLFVSATPYFCPVSLSRGRNSRSSRPHSIKKDICKRLRQQQLIDHDDDVEIQELVFDYAPEELLAVQRAVGSGEIHEPIPPRQYFPVIDPPTKWALLPNRESIVTHSSRYQGCNQKEPDAAFTFGLSSGLRVQGCRRFVRSLAFCRRRRNHEVRGPGRMFALTFRDPKSRRPFAIGDQCHFGLGLFVPVDEEV